MNTETILITGASGGIGAGMARAFAAAGWNVVAAARREAPLQALVEESTSRGESMSYQVADIADEASCRALAQRCKDTYGGLDVLINNAGYLGPRVPVDAYDSASFLMSLKVNILGSFQMTRECLPLLRASSRGRVVSISSYLGRHALPDCAGYVAGKFGVEGVTQVIHAEEEKNGIVSVSLAPGMVATDMLKNYLGNEDVSEYRTPLSVGEAAVRCINALSSEHGGLKLDIDPWMEV